VIVLALVGALVGIGVTLVLAGLRPPAPSLRAAVLHLTTVESAGPLPGAGPAGSALHAAAGRASLHVVAALGLDRIGGRADPARARADLALTGTSPGRLAGEKVGYGLLGLLFPSLMTAILTVAGLALPLALPAAAGLALGIGLSVVPDVDLRRRAARARGQMRRTVCAYLELVALERAADAGAVESLERAASIGQGPGFDHIRDALLRARLEGRTPWTQLTELAEELQVPELGDVADIMRLSGEDGAAVLPTLRARAASLRTSLLQADVAAANEASERMSIPVALLGIAFMALLGFPALWRILFG
jgi:hypothetical protein